MKKELLKKKLLISMLALSLATTGCKSNNNTNTTTQTTNEITTEVITEATTNEITTQTTTTETITTEVTTTEITTQATTEQSVVKDDEVISNIDADKKEIEYYLSEDPINMTVVGEKSKAFFIKCVDFIFYDTEINGVTFDELSDEAKEDVYDTFCYIDELVMVYAPNYKENIAEKYEVVKDFTKKAYFYVLSEIKEAIGEENYEKIGQIKDNVLNTISNTYENGKEKVKEWYEDFKMN